MWPNRKFIGGMFSPTILGGGSTPALPFDYGEAIPELSVPVTYRYGSENSAGPSLVTTINIDSGDTTVVLAIIVHGDGLFDATVNLIPASTEIPEPLTQLSMVSSGRIVYALYKVPVLPNGEYTIHCQFGLEYYVGLSFMWPIVLDINVDYDLSAPAAYEIGDYPTQPVGLTTTSENPALIVFAADVGYRFPGIFGDTSDIYSQLYMTGDPTPQWMIPEGPSWVGSGAPEYDFGPYVHTGVDTDLLTVESNYSPVSPVGIRIEAQLGLNVKMYVYVTRDDPANGNPVEEYIYEMNTDHADELLPYNIPIRRVNEDQDYNGTDIPGIKSISIACTGAATIQGVYILDYAESMVFSIGVAAYGVTDAFTYTIDNLDVRQEAPWLFHLAQFGPT